jgi:two-component system phosphate regulon response regulator PhoB
MSSHASDFAVSPPAVLIIGLENSRDTTLADRLRAAGCSVHAAADAASGLECAATVQPDVVLLSDGIPDADPLDVCRQIRIRANRSQPLVVLTPMASPAADGSNGTQTLEARVANDEHGIQRLTRVLLALADNAAASETSNDTLSLAGLTIDFGRHLATSDGRDLRLTPTEFRLLWTLARQPGRVFTRQQLTLSSGGTSGRTQVRTIDAHIKSIRQKLGARAELVETVHGVGYRFREQTP